ncbi:SigE family RNA polymerase sigma factor [Nocardioides sp.]|uniref:SigE family RNA polymerase sigma factor n=1 Tax=Nocardioides sp. TaxID=35761 RepID=UPI00271BDD73|nr:SigE family RNA polymerase sigma factor [Nocardioides sp.]MDO9455869.1 SigE family RNA polymerase sigma factor [Nocardioides sp.]
METIVSEPRTGLTFDDFVAARSTGLWRSAFLLTGDRQKAEDLLQAALVKTWRRWDRIEHGAHETAEAYVRRALVTTYTDWWRRRWRGEVPTGDLPDGAGPVDEAARVDVRRDVLTALATLSKGQRAVLVLRYFDDLTEQQTADALGVSVGTVKSQASRAIAALRSSPALSDRQPGDDS